MNMSAFFSALADDDVDLTLSLIDVGCSGGLEARWDAFGDRLHAVAIDPLCAEIARLSRAERRPFVRYRAASVGLSPEQEERKAAALAAASQVERFDHNIYARKSAYAAMPQADYVREHFNAGAEVIVSKERTWVDALGVAADVLKVDTDTCDLEVLMGAAQTLRSGVLCVQTECGFHDPLHAYASSFANIDQLLRGLGFTLYKLTPYTYTRRDLPGQFVYELPAQTIQGPVEWADLVYLRDLAHPNYAAAYDFHVSPERVRTALRLFALLDLPDCAAELIARRGDFLSADARTAALDALTPGFLGEGVGYAEYLRRFRADPMALAPSRQAQR